MIVDRLFSSTCLALSDALSLFAIILGMSLISVLVRPRILLASAAEKNRTGKMAGITRVLAVEVMIDDVTLQINRTVCD